MISLRPYAACRLLNFISLPSYGSSSSSFYISWGPFCYFLDPFMVLNSGYMSSLLIFTSVLFLMSSFLILYLLMTTSKTPSLYSINILSSLKKVLYCLNLLKFEVIFSPHYCETISLHYRGIPLYFM